MSDLLHAFNYETLERVYQEALAGEDEPDLILIRPWPKSPTMRRRLGRAVRRGLVKKGELVEIVNKRGVWCGVVIV